LSANDRTSLVFHACVNIADWFAYLSTFSVPWWTSAHERSCCVFAKFRLPARIFGTLIDITALVVSVFVARFAGAFVTANCIDTLSRFSTWVFLAFIDICTAFSVELESFATRAIVTAWSVLAYGVSGITTNIYISALVNIYAAIAIVRISTLTFAGVRTRSIYALPIGQTEFWIGLTFIYVLAGVFCQSLIPMLTDAFVSRAEILAHGILTLGSPD